MYMQIQIHTLGHKNTLSLADLEGVLYDVRPPQPLLEMVPVREKFPFSKS